MTFTFNEQQLSVIIHALKISRRQVASSLTEYEKLNMDNGAVCHVLRTKLIEIDTLLGTIQTRM